MSGLESEFRKGEVGRVLGSSGVGLGMGIPGVGAANGFGNEFGGELRRASEALPTARSGGIAESSSMPALGENRTLSSTGTADQPNLQAAMAPADDPQEQKSDPMDDDEL